MCLFARLSNISLPPSPASALRDTHPLTHFCLFIKFVSTSLFKIKKQGLLRRSVYIVYGGKKKPLIFKSTEDAPCWWWPHKAKTTSSKSPSVTHRPKRSHCSPGGRTAGVAQRWKRSEKEQNVRFAEILPLLIATGCFGTRIKGLSPLGKTGGMIQSIIPAP